LSLIRTRGARERDKTAQFFCIGGRRRQCGLDQDTTATGYIDDAAILACGDTTTETCEKLRLALEKAQRWASTHASKFAPDKFQLTHSTRSRIRFDTSKEIQTGWGNIVPNTTCKYLGVFFYFYFLIILYTSYSAYDKPGLIPRRISWSSICAPALVSFLRSCSPSRLSQVATAFGLSALILVCLWF